VPHNRMRRVISAADGQALQTAQQVMDAVRSAYQQEPGAMPIADASLNPLELVVVDGQSGRYFRIPVTGNDDGTFSFGTTRRSRRSSPTAAMSTRRLVTSRSRHIRRSGGKAASATT